MRAKALSRRFLLRSSTLLAGAGLFARSAAAETVSQAAAALQTATAQFHPTVLALVENGAAQLAQTASLLARLGLSPALISALTDLSPAIQAGGGMKHKGQVRRARNPTMIKNPNNPHFVPRGQQFSAAEQQSYAPRPMHGRGLV